MAILVKTGNPVKGTPFNIQLNKTDLLANSVVQADAYFSVQAHWKFVTVSYRSSTGNQSAVLKFDATQNTPSFNITFDDVALGSFLVDSVMIHDFDNGYIRIPRSALTTAQFDLTVEEASPASFTRTFTSGVQSWETLTPVSGADISIVQPALVIDHDGSNVGSATYYVDLDLANYPLIADQNYSIELDYVNLSSDLDFQNVGLDLGSGITSIPSSNFITLSGTVTTTVNVGNLGGGSFFNMYFVVPSNMTFHIEITEIRIIPQ